MSKLRIILVGGPRCGKSTLARKLRKQYNIPTFCTDPLSLVKDLEDGVTYLPEGMEWSESSKFVLDRWMSKEGPWCIDGIASVRAIRKAITEGKKDILEGVYILPVLKQYQDAVTKKGQISLLKGVEKVWYEILPLISNNVITEDFLESSVRD